MVYFSVFLIILVSNRNAITKQKSNNNYYRRACNKLFRRAISTSFKQGNKINYFVLIDFLPDRWVISLKRTDGVVTVLWEKRNYWIHLWNSVGLRGGLREL